MQYSRKTRSIALAAVASLSLTMSAIGGSVAIAQDTTNAATAATIDANRTGTLTIHKQANPEGDLGDPTGNVVENAPGDPLAGVGFTLYKVNDVTLTTNDGLAAAAGKTAADYLTAEGQPDTTKVTAQGTQQTTGENGQVSFSQLPLGAYLVVESNPLDGYVPAAPFLAFVPMTQNNAEAGGTTWNYDVHAYPKNYQNTPPTKTVEDSGKNKNEAITYTVTGYAQTLLANQTRTIFRIEDTLDEFLTAPQPADVTVTAPDVDLQPQDYTVTVEGQKVTVNFTETGLQKLGNNQAVQVTIPAVVNDQPENGIIPNKALVYENEPGTTNEAEPKETPEVKTYYGGVEFTKTANSPTGAGLDGAEFRVVGATQNMTCKDAVAAATDASWIKTDTDGDAPDGIYVSADGGQVLIDGLHVNDYANDTEGTANLYAKYCLVETKAPVGYELLAEPIEFTILKAEVEGGTVVKGINDTASIVNLEDTTPKLPLTGGAGVGILAALGAIIVALGAWFARRSTATK